MQSLGLSGFRQPPPLLEGFPILSQEARMQLHYEIMEAIDREAIALAAASAERTADF